LLLAVTLGVLFLGVPLVATIVWFSIPASNTPTTTPTVSSPPRIVGIGTLQLRAGQTQQAAVYLQRPDPGATLRVLIEDLPSGVQCLPAMVPAGSAGDSVNVQLTSDQKVPTQTATVTVVLYQGTRRVDERKKTLSITNLD